MFGPKKCVCWALLDVWIVMNFSFFSFTSFKMQNKTFEFAIEQKHSKSHVFECSNVLLNCHSRRGWRKKCCVWCGETSAFFASLKIFYGILVKRPKRLRLLNCWFFSFISVYHFCLFIFNVNFSPWSNCRWIVLFKKWCKSGKTCVCPFSTSFSKLEIANECQSGLGRDNLIYKTFIIALLSYLQHRTRMFGMPS